MKLVDTGAWFAAFVPNDPDHPAATAGLDSNSAALVTSDYVLDELFTLLQRRGEIAGARQVGPPLLAGDVARIE